MADCFHDEVSVSPSWSDMLKSNDELSLRAGTPSLVESSSSECRINRESHIRGFCADSHGNQLGTPSVPSVDGRGRCDWCGCSDYVTIIWDHHGPVRYECDWCRRGRYHVFDNMWEGNWPFWCRNCMRWTEWDTRSWGTFIRTATNEHFCRRCWYYRYDTTDDDVDYVIDRF